MKNALRIVDQVCAEHPRVRYAALVMALPVMCAIWMVWAAVSVVAPPREDLRGDR